MEFKIIDGNLNWNGFDLIFPIFDVNEDKIIWRGEADLVPFVPLVSA